MEVTERLKDIINILEDALSYESMESVEEARTELVCLLSDLESDTPLSFSDDDEILDDEY